LLLLVLLLGIACVVVVDDDDNVAWVVVGVGNVGVVVVVAKPTR
jgi:hypothetical protein